MPIVSIMTDFGTKDGNVGVMKGVILGIAPDASIVDISHEVFPQDVRQAAYILERQVFFFPEDSVHIVVVDPGVGTARRPIAAQIGTQRYVGPDNGVFTLIYERAEQEGLPVKTVHTDKPKYWLPKISNIFHGRDIFSPVGAHFAAGVPLEDLGTPIDDPVRLDLPKPKKTDEGCVGDVIHIDWFGNVQTNIPREMIGETNPKTITFGKTKVDGVVRTFGEREPGDIIALYNSTDFLMLAMVNGNVAAPEKIQIGDPVTVVNN